MNKLLLIIVITLSQVACAQESSIDKNTEFSITGKWTFFEEGKEDMPALILHFKENGELRIDLPNGKGDNGTYTYDADTGVLRMTDPRGKVQEMLTQQKGPDKLLIGDPVTKDFSSGMGLIR